MNSVNVVGRLTKDPELRHLPSGTEVCNMRIAIDRAGMKQDDGSYGGGFFDVDCFGKTAELCGQYMSKGRQVAITGELRWREWESEGGGKRQAVSILANRVTFIGNREDGNGGNQFAPAAGGFGADFPAAADDDIPF